MKKKRPIRFFPLRRLLAFPLLRAGEDSGSSSPSEGELLFELEGINPENLLLGRFPPEQVREKIRKAGILEGLAARGYADPVMGIECRTPEDQRVCLYAGRKSRDRLLLEVRLRICGFRPGRPIGPFSEKTVFRMLLVNWLVLSDPDRPFSLDRPRLPGQERPGLGLLGECLSLLREIARECLLDGVLDVPDHFHAALFYSRAFRFFDPVAEGRFQAMVRDLRGIPLAIASEAVRDGCLVETATGLPVPWCAAEQVMPLRDPLLGYIRSPAYSRLRDEACARRHGAVDWDRYRTKITAGGGPGKYP